MRSTLELLLIWNELRGRSGLGFCGGMALACRLVRTNDNGIILPVNYKDPHVLLVTHPSGTVSVIVGSSSIDLWCGRLQSLLTSSASLSDPFDIQLYLIIATLPGSQL